MAAIEHVSERLHDTGSTDVEMPAVSEESDLKSSASAQSLTNNLLSSPMDPGNEEFQMKFMVTGTSNRPHHSGKKKVVRIISTEPSHIISPIFLVMSFSLVLMTNRRWRILNLSKCWAKERLAKSFYAERRAPVTFSPSKS